ncbi:MAG: FGGY family carbohydrate kinase [Flavobacteriaceae bacterium]
MYYIGYDVGSSSVKGALVECQSGKVMAIAQKPETEMEMISLKPGWAEQDPDHWWQNICSVTHALLSKSRINPAKISGIGIAYQMHGLVVVGSEGVLLRKSIIWCDGRAVEIGNRALNELGADRCSTDLLNAPGNFTASKLRWLKENEPQLYSQIYKIMLPGDYIAYKFSGSLCTTIPGLSEGIFWDFSSNKLATSLLDYYEIDRHLLPDIADTFSMQGTVSEKASMASGLKKGTPILYRAGDQPNNALSLNVLDPGEVATTGGTSGVVYAVTDSLSVKESTRVNNFAHVNHSKEKTRIGKLLCINGTGILYRWLLDNLDFTNYEEMNSAALDVAAGSYGLRIYPFGNGPERMLDNKDIGAKIDTLNFNIHSKSHLCRATLEGIAFSFAYGMDIMRRDGVTPHTIKTGYDNLFRSELFAQMVSTLFGSNIEVYNTTGAVGAARACLLHKGEFDTFKAQLSDQDFIKSYRPEPSSSSLFEFYGQWKEGLNNTLKSFKNGI